MFEWLPEIVFKCSNPDNAYMVDMTKTAGVWSRQFWQMEKLGSDEFCKIGPTAACVVDYPEHTAPKSQQKYRPGSIRFQKNGFL